MATTKPRITVTLTERQHEVLRTISDCVGQPMSRFISELLELSLPSLERMAATFQKIKRVHDSQRNSILEAIDDAQTALEPIALDAIGQLDLFLAKMESACDATETDARSIERAVSGGARALSAPATNRGATQGRGIGEKPCAATDSGVFSKTRKNKTTG